MKANGGAGGIKMQELQNGEFSDGKWKPVDRPLPPSHTDLPELVTIE
jgi:hypothetical protein